MVRCNKPATDRKTNGQPATTVPGEVSPKAATDPELKHALIFTGKKVGARTLRLRTTCTPQQLCRFIEHPETQPILIGRKEVARLTGLNVQTIDAASARNQLRRFKVGRRVLYLLSDVMQWIESHED